MAERPENTRLINVFNPGVDKRIPLGFVDQVIDKETGLLVGFVEDGQFYNLGDKVKKSTKPNKEPKASDLDKSITMVEDLLSKKEKEAIRLVGTDKYVEITEAIKQDKVSLEALKKRRDAAKGSETSKEEQDTYQAETNTYKSKVEAATRKLKVAKDTNGDIGTAQTELDDILKTKPFAPSGGTAAPQFGGQPTGYQNIGTQKTGVTPTTPTTQQQSTETPQ